jgi:hypothetical protein
MLTTIRRDAGDGLARVFRGRPVKNTPDAATLDAITRWVADCNENHQCRPGSRPMPHRLVDIGSAESEESPRLVELDEGTEGRYTTLSYCWGPNGPRFLTTNAVLAAQTGEIDLEHLPKVFQDAITLTRSLGVRYIWIDGVCIPQDDSQNWNRDSARMSAVYANAYLTISATGARDSSDGLFFDRLPRQYLRVPHTSGDVHGSLLMCTLPLEKEFIRDRYVEMKSEPLSKRGWAFQERVLSRRTVHFASDQIYFECMTRFVSEDGLVHKERYLTVSPNVHVDEETKPGLDEPGRKRKNLQRWYDLLCYYGSRELSDPSDKLAAISSIARAFSEILNDEYVAGLWRGSIIEDLCWQPLRCQPVDGYRAPSWSWAAVNGLTLAGFLAKSYEPAAVILDTHVDLDGGDPFGKVKAAWIKMEAPLVPLSLSKKRGPLGHLFLRTEKGDEDGSFAGFDTIDRQSGSEELVRGMKLFALVVALTQPMECYSSGCGGPCYHCPIVTPVDDDMDRVKRIGFLLMGPESFGPDEIASSRRVITFV